MNTMAISDVDFRGQLKFSKISDNVKKWQKISRAFEKASQNSTVDMFVAKDSDGIVNIGISTEKAEKPSNLLLGEKVSALFAQMSDKKLLSKFFKLSDAISKTGDAAKGLEHVSSDAFFKNANLL